ncbi:MAG: thioredoxin family protein [Erysipelotrichales bacterium]
MKELFEADFKQVIENGLILVEFNAKSGSTCKLNGPFLKGMQNDIKIDVAYLDFDQASSLEEEYKLLVSPTFIIFKEGKEVNRIEGFVSKGQIINMIDKEI